MVTLQMKSLATAVLTASAGAVVGLLVGRELGRAPTDEQHPPASLSATGARSQDIGPTILPWTPRSDNPSPPDRERGTRAFDTLDDCERAFALTSVVAVGTEVGWEAADVGERPAEILAALAKVLAECPDLEPYIGELDCDDYPCLVLTRVSLDRTEQFRSCDAWNRVPKGLGKGRFTPNGILMVHELGRGDALDQAPANRRRVDLRVEAALDAGADSVQLESSASDAP